MYFTEDQRSLKELTRRFVENEINPYMDEWEKTTAPLHELFKKMGDLGLLGIRYDPAYGGQGLDYWFETAFLEELGYIHGWGVPTAIAVQTNMATPAIAEFGSEYLKDTYLRSAIAGDLVSAIAVTEPGAGSDVAALRTTAKRDGDSYIINGSKIFITNGVQADFYTLLARSSDESGSHVFSLFVVPSNLPGVTVGRDLDKVGVHSCDTAELFFDNVRVPSDNLIGEEGEGFIYQMKQFQHERFALLPIVCTTLRYVIDLTKDYIKERVVFGKPLISKQVLRHRMADWLTEIECLQQLIYHIVRMKMEGLDVTKEVSMGKLFAAKVVGEVINGCVQMHGGMGYMNEMLIARFYRDHRAFAIGGGADEIMREIISRIALT
jgi:citronellyl-CoA dehydrogenase